MFSKGAGTSTIAVVCAVLSWGCAEERVPDETATAPTYIGTESCAGCHADQALAHAESHHALAMQTASASSVRARVDEDPSEGVYRDADGYWFADAGERQPVTHTFGVHPLQQYLVEADGGKKQALTLAWDARPAINGGQRFYELYPPESPGGEIHWSSRGMTWNSMCADCHSTGIVKGFDDGVFATTYVEENVGCEACHGPGSAHRDDPKMSLETTTDVCLPCHSRRTQLRDGYRPGLDVFDFYQVVPIAPPLYHADGQIDDEVYVWGSFQQSRMSAAGVTCLDCHDVHRAGASSPSATTCTACHSERGNPRFPTLVTMDYLGEDHFRGPGHEEVTCLDCHMPNKTYMGVDVRHDHSFRIPDPQLSAALGSLDPCATCHDDGPAAINRLLDDEGRGRARERSAFAVLAAGHENRYDALPALIEIATGRAEPLLRRTQALRLIARYDKPQALDAARTALADPHPLIRIAATMSLDRFPAAPRWGAIKRLLADPVRAVRFAVVDRAVSYLSQPIENREATLIREVVDDYVETLVRDADLPQSHVARGALSMAMGEFAAAREAFDEALAIEPQWIGALINLSILEEESGNTEAAADALATATAVKPSSPSALYAAALFHVRQGERGEAARLLREAYSLAPTNLQFGYAAALARAPNADGAIDDLIALQAKFGSHTSVLTALATHLRDAERIDEAIDVARLLVAEHGAAFQPLLNELEQRSRRR